MDNATMYEHYLDLFHTAITIEQRSFARKRVNFYGREIGYSEYQLREDKLPRVDFSNLLGLKGSLASDGEE